MPVQGKAELRTPDAIRKVAELHQCEPAVIDAILRVEANGKGFDHNKLVIIRPEAHKVAENPLLTAAQKIRARKLGFTTQPRARRGQLENDVNWDFVDRMAKEFGEEAAYWPVSFGAPQIMGFNYRMAGYDSIKKMVLDFADSEDAQIEAMGRFLKAAGLTPALKNKRWKQIARFYNGPAYAENDYDSKLERFYASSAEGKNAVAEVARDDDVIEFGDRGDKVKTVQQRLRDLGFSSDADGDFGQETKDAVCAFQRRHGLTVDGRVDVLTSKALYEAPAKEPNAKPVAQIAMESRTIQAGAGSIATGAGAVAVAAAEGGSEVFDSLNAATEHAHTVTESADSIGRLVGSLTEALQIVQHHLLFVLGAGAIGFGAIAIYRRVQAQRQRKVG